MTLSAFVIIASLVVNPAQFSDIKFHSISTKEDVFEDDILTNFALPEQAFHVAIRKQTTLIESKIDIYTLQFPSFVNTMHMSNNTVFGEYFKPKEKCLGPGVLVLDILDGAGLVSRGEAVWLAANGIPALTLTMPYYGQRRPTNEKIRLLSTDLNQSMVNIRQAILDARRGIAWLSVQPEIDPERIGIVGTSLGSFLGAVTAATEPKVKSACLLLGGGDLVEAYYDHPQAAWILQALRLVGITKQKLKHQIATVDPIAYASFLKKKNLLLIGATRDEIVPPYAMKQLWNATGHPRIVWFNSTHVGAAAHGFKAMNLIIEHVKKP